MYTDKLVVFMCVSKKELSSPANPFWLGRYDHEPSSEILTVATGEGVLRLEESTTEAEDPFL